jgi:hypothetical protein
MGRKTNKQRRQAKATSARERAAASRAQQQRADQRRRAMTILGSVVGIAVVVVVIAIVAINQHSKTASATKASTAVVSQVTGVPAATTNAVGTGTALQAGLPLSMQGTPLDADGKPTVLFIGGEFCPYCAAQRWAIVESLSRFGTFSGLQQIKSSEDNISTFTFLHAKYTSQYINFDGKEEADQQSKPLEKLTSTEQAQWSKWLAPGSVRPGYPFMDYDGKYVGVDPMVDPSLLSGKTWAEIAGSLKDPTSTVARSIDGAANNITAAICKLTDNKPANVCTADVTKLSGNFQAYPTS